MYYYLHNDHSDITGLVDEEYNLQNSYEYDAFGDITKENELVPNEFKYYEQQFDNATHLYYLRARYYNPTVGRFTQEDVYRGDGLNLYAYVKNNPIMWVDPSGYKKYEASIEVHFNNIVGENGAGINDKALNELKLAIQAGTFKTSEEIIAISDKAESLGLTEVFENKMKTMDFGKYMENMGIIKPSDMEDAHGHYILYKTGNGPNQKELVEKGQKLLRELKINPIIGLENLVFAPNIKGQHIEINLKKVVDGLEAVKNNPNATREDALEVLAKAGKEASKLTKDICESKGKN